MSEHKDGVSLLQVFASNGAGNAMSGRRQHRKSVSSTAHLTLDKSVGDDVRALHIAAVQSIRDYKATYKISHIQKALDALVNTLVLHDRQGGSRRQLLPVLLDRAFCYATLGFHVYGYDEKLLRAGILDVNEVLSIDPTCSIAFARRALLKWARSECDSALVDVNHAVALDPRNMEAFQIKTEILLDMGDDYSAVLAIRRAIRLDTSNHSRWLLEKLKDGEYHTRLARLHHMAERREKAVGHYFRSMQKNAKGNASSVRMLACIAFDGGETESALPLAQYVLELSDGTDEMMSDLVQDIESHRSSSPKRTSSPAPAPSMQALLSNSPATAPANPSAFLQLTEQEKVTLAAAAKLAAQPGEARALATKAGTSAQSGDHVNAAILYSQALDIMPDNAHYMEMLDQALRAMELKGAMLGFLEYDFRKPDANLDPMSEPNSPPSTETSPSPRPEEREGKENKRNSLRRKDSIFDHKTRDVRLQIWPDHLYVTFSKRSKLRQKNYEARYALTDVVIMESVGAHNRLQQDPDKQPAKVAETPRAEEYGSIHLSMPTISNMLRAEMNLGSTSSLLSGRAVDRLTIDVFGNGQAVITLTQDTCAVPLSRVEQWLQDKISKSAESYPVKRRLRSWKQCCAENYGTHLAECRELERECDSLTKELERTHAAMELAAAQNNFDAAIEHRTATKKLRDQIVLMKRMASKFVDMIENIRTEGERLEYEIQYLKDTLHARHLSAHEQCEALKATQDYEQARVYFSEKVRLDSEIKKLVKYRQEWLAVYKTVTQDEVHIGDAQDGVHLAKKAPPQDPNALDEKPNDGAHGDLNGTQPVDGKSAAGGGGGGDGRGGELDDTAASGAVPSSASITKVMNRAPSAPPASAHGHAPVSDSKQAADALARVRRVPLSMRSDPKLHFASSSSSNLLLAAASRPQPPPPPRAQPSPPVPPSQLSHAPEQDGGSGSAYASPGDSRQASVLNMLIGMPSSEPADGRGSATPSASPNSSQSGSPSKLVVEPSLPSLPPFSSSANISPQSYGWPHIEIPYSSSLNPGGDDNDDGDGDDAQTDGAEHEDGPQAAVCPLTQRPLVDPVVAADGHVYERSAIEEWISGSPRLPTSPMTGLPLAHTLLFRKEQIAPSAD